MKQLIIATILTLVVLTKVSASEVEDYTPRAAIEACTKHLQTKLLNEVQSSTKELAAYIDINKYALIIAKHNQFIPTNTIYEEKQLMEKARQIFIKSSIKSCTFGKTFDEIENKNKMSYNDYVKAFISFSLEVIKVVNKTKIQA